MNSKAPTKDIGRNSEGASTDLHSYDAHNSLWPRKG